MRPPPGGALPWSWRGRVRHEEAVAEMEARRARLLEGDAAAAEVILCEHDPVITLGRAADPAHVLLPPEALAARGVTLARASRGGDVTYHGPGQLMVYPVVRLRAGVVAHLEVVAGVLAEVAAELGAPGAVFRRAPAGLWLGDRKLAACGIHVRRGVAIHGFALDVATPAEAWRAILPCGMAGAPVISLATARGGEAPTVAEVAARVGPRLAAALVAMSARGGTMLTSPPQPTDRAASSSSTTPTTTRS